MFNIRHGLILLTFTAAAIPSAAAQSTLPPPPKRPPLPEYVPPTQRERPNANPNANPTQPKFDPSKVEFEPIWTVNDDGSVTGPDEFYEVAALRNNPLIDEDLWSFIEVLLEDRNKEMEFVALAHPRVCVDALTHVIEEFDVNDAPTRTALGDVAQALNQPGGFIGYLVEQGMITQDMGVMSQYIASEYTLKVMQGIKADMPDASQDDVTSVQSQFLITQGLLEPLMGFGRLARRAIEANPDLVDNADQILALKDDAFNKAAAEALAPLSNEELKKVLTDAYEAAHGPIDG